MPPEFSLFMGLSVPAYFEGYVTSYTPGAAELLAPLPDALRDLIKAIGTTGMAVAALIGIILDNVIPGMPAERGLSGVIRTAEGRPASARPTGSTKE